jgi:anti-sigma-K factor RskA
MKQPSEIEIELLELAAPYALDAVTLTDRANIETRLAAAPEPITHAFHCEVRTVREALATISSTTATEPLAALRARVLSAVLKPSHHRLGWRSTLLAAAAAVAIGLGSVGIGLSMRHLPAPSETEQVLTAPDVRTSTVPISAGGTATIVYSRQHHAGVLVMNNLTPPAPGTVYQMWLLNDRAPTSAGTIGPTAVTPSTTAVLPDLGKSTALAFTIEPGTGSPQPTGAIIAKLPLA